MTLGTFAEKMNPAGVFVFQLSTVLRLGVRYQVESTSTVRSFSE
jgi:hypothetical protein